MSVALDALRSESADIKSEIEERLSEIKVLQAQDKELTDAILTLETYAAASSKAPYDRQKNRLGPPPIRNTPDSGFDLSNFLCMVG